MYYLDNAATTRPYDEIIQLTQTWLSEIFANPSSNHPAGHKARELIEASRQRLANALGAPKPGVIFCASGTESDNLAIKGVVEARSNSPGNIITTRLEHAAVLNAMEWAADHGEEIRYVDTGKETGAVNLEQLGDLIDNKTKLVSIQHVNSEIGVIQNLANISKTIRLHNSKTVFHSDGVQAFGKFPVTLNQLGVDLYSISGHKFHSIKGAAALVFTKKIEVKPQALGGGQEFGMRSGTENTVAIAALGKAAQKIASSVNQDSKRVVEFKTRFTEAVRRGNRNILIVDLPNSLPHIINFSVKGIPGEVLQNHLAEKGIYISTGSACSEKSKKLSPTLQSLGFTSERIRESVRLSIMANEIPVEFNAFHETFLSVVDDLIRLI